MPLSVEGGWPSVIFRQNHAKDPGGRKAEVRRQMLVGRGDVEVKVCQHFPLTPSIS